MLVFPNNSIGEDHLEYNAKEVISRSIEGTETTDEKSASSAVEKIEMLEPAEDKTVIISDGGRDSLEATEELADNEVLSTSIKEKCKDTVAHENEEDTHKEAVCIPPEVNEDQPDILGSTNEVSEMSEEITTQKVLTAEDKRDVQNAVNNETPSNNPEEEDKTLDNIRSIKGDTEVSPVATDAQQKVKSCSEADVDSSKEAINLNNGISTSDSVQIHDGPDTVKEVSVKSNVTFGVNMNIEVSLGAGESDETEENIDGSKISEKIESIKGETSTIQPVSRSLELMESCLEEKGTDTENETSIQVEEYEAEQALITSKEETEEFSTTIDTKEIVNAFSAEETESKIEDFSDTVENVLTGTEMEQCDNIPCIIENSKGEDSTKEEKLRIPLDTDEAKVVPNVENEKSVDTSVHSSKLESGTTENCNAEADLKNFNKSMSSSFEASTVEDKWTKSSILENKIISESSKSTTSSEYKTFTNITTATESQEYEVIKTSKILMESGTDDRLSSETFSIDDLSPHCAELPVNVEAEFSKAHDHQIKENIDLEEKLDSTDYASIQQITETRLSQENRSSSQASDISDKEIPASTPRSDVTVSPGPHDSGLTTASSLKFVWGDNAESFITDTVDIMTQSMYVSSTGDNDDEADESLGILVSEDEKDLSLKNPLLQMTETVIFIAAAGKEPSKQAEQTDRKMEKQEENGNTIVECTPDETNSKGKDEPSTSTKFNSTDAAKTTSDTTFDTEDGRNKDDPIAGWGKPLGLPSPVRPGTPAKQSKKGDEEQMDSNKVSSY